MAKKQKRRPNNIENKPEQDASEFSEKTLNIYKRILKIMSWTVGVSFVLIIILHLFNNQTLDILSKYLFRIGFLILIAFTVLEFIGDTVKQKIERIVNASDESKSTSS